MMLMASREMRVIPRGWQHPKNDKGHYIGLMGDYEEHVAYYAANPTDDPDEGPFPREEFMPSVADLAPEQTEIAAYETVSEGTPMSPAFDNTPEGRFAMLKWCSENCDVPGFRDRKTSIEAWAAMLLGSALVDMQTGSVTA